MTQLILALPEEISILRNIVLCGCGWLGNQLIAPIQTLEYTVSATCRTMEKRNSLIEQSVLAATFTLGDTFPDYLLLDSLPNTVIVMIPPGRRSANTQHWESSLVSLFHCLDRDSVDHVIFISTTSVYGEPENYLTISEMTQVAPKTASACAHVRVENQLRKILPQKSSIVRLAGLVGPNRHPIKTLSGKQLVMPNKVVNLVHGEDVVRALERLIRLGHEGQPLHLCSKSHPQRQAYYEKSAEAFNLPKPRFTRDSESKEDCGKAIDASQSWARLGMKPKYCSPYDMLP